MAKHIKTVACPFCSEPRPRRCPACHGAGRVHPKAVPTQPCMEVLHGLQLCWSSIAPDVFDCCRPRGGSMSPAQVREIVYDHAEYYVDTGTMGRQRTDSGPRWKDLSLEDRDAHLLAAFPNGTRHCL